MSDDGTVNLRRRATALLVALVATLPACETGASVEGPAESARAEPALDVHVPPPTPVPTLPPPASTTTEPAEPPTPVSPWQVLVAVARPEVGEIETFDAPGGDPVRFELRLKNPWHFGGELALLVTAGAEGDEWLEVSVPTRPNGTRAWIRAADVTFRTHHMRAEVSLGRRTVRVWNGDELLVESVAVVGARSTPTPLGRFYVNVRMRHKNPRGAYGPWILGLSGYSEALDTFNGAIPVLALHGTNRPDLLGQARSNGCIRLPNHVIERLAEIVPLGTPVDVVA
jgi:hypothetical protein